MRWRAGLAAWMAAVVVTVSAAATTVRADASTTTISGVELARLMDQGVTVIDVRRADEWRATGVIPGSRLITAFDADGRLNPRFADEVAAAVARDQPVALICRSGNRSGKAAALLTGQSGFSRVYNVEGGVAAWSSHGRPLTACPVC